MALCYFYGTRQGIPNFYLYLFVIILFLFKLENFILNLSDLRKMSSRINNIDGYKAYKRIMSYRMNTGWLNILG